LKILLTGKNGQLGMELQRSLTPLGDVVALDRAALDLAQPGSIAAVLREASPDVVVNAAAYTAVERAEREPELAEKVNALAPGVLAEEARRAGALLVHFSTDYVFDGAKRAPYAEDDATRPLNVYGRTKLAGERAVRAAGGRWIVLRTSWVYSAHGRNFLLAILEKARREREIRVVADQVGAPTWSRLLAQASATVIKLGAAGDAPSGLFHLSAGGSGTWHAFAEEIVRLAGLTTRVVPVRSDEYPGVTRPAFSLLSSERIATAFGVRLPDWRAGVEACFQTSFQP
jgi:dTDP-4-dehydrorhamnose reductase